MTKHFQRELDKIRKMILSLSALVEERVHIANQAIENMDRDAAERILQSDREIDEMEVEIEDECLKALALYQPVAVDLRFIITVIKINSDLERIGDLAVNIAYRVLRLTKHEMLENVFDYRPMAEKTEWMLKACLDAFVNLDVDLARKVLEMDEEVDAIKSQAYDRIKQALAENHPRHIGFLFNFLLISRHLERLADHTTNIAEEVIYLIEGEIVRHGSAGK